MDSGEPRTAAGRRFVDRHGTGKQVEIVAIEDEAYEQGREDGMTHIRAARDEAYAEAARAASEQVAALRRDLDDATRVLGILAARNGGAVDITDRELAEFEGTVVSMRDVLTGTLRFATTAAPSPAREPLPPPMTDIPTPETLSTEHPDPLIQAWRDFTIRFTNADDPVRGSSPIREAFAAGWDAAARAALEQVAALREQVAHYTAGCWCLNRPWCVPHGWAGTDPDVERGICSDHDHFASPAPSPARDTSAPERGARSAPRRRRTPAYSRTTRAAAAERDALKEAYEAYRRHEATPSEQTYWRALDEAIRALLASPAPSPAREPLRELVAEAIYDAMRENDSEGRNRPWLRGGNSIKQDEARRRADAALARLSDNP